VGRPLTTFPLAAKNYDVLAAGRDAATEFRRDSTAFPRLSHENGAAMATMMRYEGFREGAQLSRFLLYFFARRA
jgi:hypothetical protein